MCVKEWKRIAEWEASHYRERVAFLKGVEDAGGGFSPRAAQYRKWVRAVDCVLAYLARNDTEKERFFRACFGIDGGRKQTDKKGMLALTFPFHAGLSTLYQWQNELLSLLLIAAAQTGAIVPFRSETKK
ncbi:MAG: hypothetical protein IJL62_02625 [Clostridia bacterium]|nr:hypothetical protein [Clostridia bacterium]